MAADQFYTLKTGNDSNAKALRMLVFSWRQDTARSKSEISGAKKSARSLIWRFSEYGVDEGDRTLDNGSHNPVLYQLSYAHHIALTKNSTIFFVEPRTT